MLDIDTARAKAYEAETVEKPYPVDRGLFDEGKDGGPRGYDTLTKPLATQLSGMGLSELITQTPRGKLLDAGCGTGRFLTDCCKRWPGIEAHGISAFLYHMRIDPETGRFYMLERIQRLGVAIQRGDVQNLDKLYPPNSFDFVTCIRVVEHLADPWAVLRGMHRLAKPGGFGFITGFTPHIATRRDQGRLGEYLQTQGFKILPTLDSCHWDLGFQKKENPVALPIELASVDLSNIIPKVIYRLR